MRGYNVEIKDKSRGEGKEDRGRGLGRRDYVLPARSRRR